MGSRFNILRFNGAGVYFLYDRLLHFFGKTELHNKRLEAVHWDLNVLAYRVGCRVDKMTRWCVELIFAGLEVATRRMLHDHTKQGRFDSADDQELVSETSSVATINVESERFCNA